MDLTLIVKNNCDACTRVKRVIKNLAKKKKEILLSVINIKDLEKQITPIVPALFVNQKLYSYGDINEEKLLVYLKEEYKQGACNRQDYKRN
jgi:glutaredoxin